MTLLPIVERELRVASRRRGTYWNRLIVAGIAVLAFAVLFLLSASEPNLQVGRTLFSVLSVGFLVISLLTGAVYTADAISTEKREETLGLLFLTDLKAYDVVSGKLVACSVGAVYALLAMFPVLAIPLLLGGVTWGEFVRVVLVLVNTLFLSLSVGMMVSAMVRQPLVAMATTLVLVVGINALGPLTAVWIGATTHTAPPESLLVPSVGYALAVAHDSLYRARVTAFVTSLLITQGMAWTSLFLACERTRRAWRMASSTMEATWRVRLAGWLRGDERRQVGWRQEAMDANPCYWLGCRLWYKRWIVWAGLGVLALLWLAGFAQVGWPWVYDEGVALLSVLVLHTVLRWWIAAEACLAFGSDKQSGALELLLCTGLSVPEIVRGRLLALQRQFLAPSIGVLLFDLWMLAVVLSRASSAGDESWWVACFVCLALVYVADMVALAWLGLWWSLVCRRATRALLRCGVIVFGVPWALLVGFLVLLGVAGVILPRPVEFLLLGAYVLVGLGVSLVACSRARENLLYRLRSVTAGESSPPLQQRGVYATMPEGKP